MYVYAIAVIPIASIGQMGKSLPNEAGRDSGETDSVSTATARNNNSTAAVNRKRQRMRKKERDCDSESSASSCSSSSQYSAAHNKVVDLVDQWKTSSSTTNSFQERSASLQFLALHGTEAVKNDAMQAIIAQAFPTTVMGPPTTLFSPVTAIINQEE